MKFLFVLIVGLTLFYTKNEPQEKKKLRNTDIDNTKIVFDSLPNGNPPII